jgi:hypothetical protein
LLAPLRRVLTRSQWQNLILVMLAVQLARSFILRRVALYLCCAITSASCYRRLERILSWDAAVWGALSRAWVRAVVACFAPGNGCLILVIDWTLHRDRCRSLWIGIPVEGRTVPLAFWLAPPQMGGKGAQRTFEDAALTQLRGWLPRRRRVLLIGDRGFRGRDRMKFLKRLGFRFLLRITGDTQVRIDGEWVALREMAPGVGERREWRNVVYGKSDTGERVRVNIVAVRQALPEPRPVRTNKGKRTQQVAEETIWFLATDLPLWIDTVAVYRLRMQVEETFRDAKDLLGLEEEETEQPWERLPGLMWALTIGMGLDLQRGGAAVQTPRSLPHAGPERNSVAPVVVPEYRAESATREGLHELVVEIVLGHSPFTEELRGIAAKSERMKARPQVRDRRCRTPAARRRTKSQTELHVHA